MAEINETNWFFLGVSSERRANEIKRLNNTYLDVVALRKSLRDSLDYMVETESYRWIACTTYSLNPKPLRSDRNFDQSSETTFLEESVRIFFFLN